MINCLVFILANIIISRVLEHKKFYIATSIHTISFVILLPFSLVFNLAPLVIKYLNYVNISKELIEEVKYLSSYSSKEFVNALLFLTALAWVVVISASLITNIKVVRKIIIKYKRVYICNNIRNERRKPFVTSCLKMITYFKQPNNMVMNC